MKKLMTLVLPLVSMFIFAFTATSGAQYLVSDRPSSKPAQDVVPDEYLVELAVPTTIEGNSAATVQQAQAAFLTSVDKEKSKGNVKKFQVLDKFKGTVFNGFAVEMDSDTAKLVASLPGVKSVQQVRVYYPDSAKPRLVEPMAIRAFGEPEDDAWLRMTGADRVHRELGITGRGVRVGVMDTGIDYTHPELGGCFGPGCRVEGGYDFVGDRYTGPPFGIVEPDDDPYDQQGHGTHVSGIVGARANGPSGVTGVAPFARLYAYKVFGPTGATTDRFMLQALQRAYEDRVSVLNISIGSPNGVPTGDFIDAIDRVVLSGTMSISISAGNNADLGLYAVASPSVAEQAISVASFDAFSTRLKKIRVGDDFADVGFIQAAASPAPPTTGDDEIVATGTPQTPDDACAPLSSNLLEGKVALIRRGGCTFYQKAKNAQDAGAVAVLIYNNQVGPPPSITVAGSPPITIPVVAISQADGIGIYERLTQGPVFMWWTSEFMFTEVFVEYGPASKPELLSDFSSFGPVRLNLKLKPDIGAPGGFIRSTYPVVLGRYNTLNGTSMAAPQVTGAIALLREARPDIASHLVRDILQNSASPAVWSLDPHSGYLDITHRQGAGLLDIYGALVNLLSGDSRVVPGKLSLGETRGLPVTRTLVIQNNSRQPVTYSFDHVAALATTARQVPTMDDYLPASATVTFSRPSLTVNAGSFGTVVVTFRGPADMNAKLFGGYVTASPDNGLHTLRVPYLGWNGTR